MSNKSNESSTFLKAVLVKVSDPMSFENKDRQGITDLFKLGFKTKDGKRILVVLTLSQLGWTGELHKSLVYYYNKKSQRLIKSSMSNPERFIGQKFGLRGLLETLSGEKDKYRLARVDEVIMYLD